MKLQILKLLYASVLSVLMLAFPNASLASDSLKTTIIGAGPGGLALGIAALLHGREVEVYEKRLISSDDLDLLKNYNESIYIGNDGSHKNQLWASRNRVVLLDQSVFEAFKTMGIEMEHLNSLETFTIQYGLGSAHRTTFNRNAVFAENMRRLLGRKVSGTAALRDIEVSLLKRFLELGGKVHFGSSTSVEERQQYQSFDDTHHLVVADGVTNKGSNPKRESFGFPKTLWIVGTFRLSQKIFESETIWETRSLNENPYYTMVIKQNDLATIYISPFESYSPNLEMGSEQIALQCARQMGIEGQLLETQVFDVDPDFIRVHARDGVFYIGDRARKSDPTTGYGVSLAIGDAMRYFEYLEDLNITDNTFAKSSFQAKVSESVIKTKQQLKIVHAARKYIKSLTGQVGLRLAIPLWSKYFELASFTTQPRCEDLLN